MADIAVLPDGDLRSSNTRAESVHLKEKNKSAKRVRHLEGMQLHRAKIGDAISMEPPHRVPAVRLTWVATQRKRISSRWIRGKKEAQSRTPLAVEQKKVRE